MTWIINFIVLCVRQFIPMPVLYGVFLYMGVASLNGVQVIFTEFYSLSNYTSPTCLCNRD